MLLALEFLDDLGDELRLEPFNSALDGPGEFLAPHFLLSGLYHRGGSLRSCFDRWRLWSGFYDRLWLGACFHCRKVRLDFQLRNRGRFRFGDRGRYFHG